MAKRAPVRKPFVMITAALAVGCGARVDAPVEAVTDSGTVSDAPSVPDTLPPGCPTSEPKAGAPCAPEGVSCDWGRCYAPLWMGGNFYVCTKGTWMAGASSCNPPPPDPPCPMDEPTVGTPCVRASYADKCQYKDACPQNPFDYGSNDYVCDSWTWKMTSPAYSVKCPATAPTNGSACLCGPHMVGVACNYSDCSFTTASCSNKAWSVTMSTCNPPAVDAGSAP